MAAATRSRTGSAVSACVQMSGRLQTGGVMRQSSVRVAMVSELLLGAGWLLAPAAQAADPVLPGSDVSSSPPDQSTPSRPATPDEAMPRTRILAPIARGYFLGDYDALGAAGTTFTPIFPQTTGTTGPAADNIYAATATP